MILDRNRDPVWPGDIVADEDGKRYEVLSHVRMGRDDLRCKELDGTRRGIELLCSDDVVKSD